MSTPPPKKLPVAEPAQKFALVPKIINGGIAGIVGMTAVFPLDLVKTRLQNQTVGPNGEKQYRNMFDCFTQTFRREGFFGMYRGCAVLIVLITPEKAIKLVANDLFRFHLRLPDGSLPLTHQMAAGGLAGAFQSLMSTPLELLKIQLQDAGRVAALTSKTEKVDVPKIRARDVAVKLLKERGIFGLHRGIGPTAARDIIFSVIYFPLFAVLSQWGLKEHELVPPFWWSFVTGCIAGSTAALAVTPLDVVKTRLQTLTKGTGDRQYTSLWDCISKVWKYEGPLAFFKGGACRMIVIAPLYGIAQVVYFFGVGEYLLGVPKTRVI